MNAAPPKLTFAVVIRTIHEQNDTVEVSADSMHVNESGNLIFRTGQSTTHTFAAGVWQQAKQKP